jgi:hypothetical protein
MFRPILSHSLSITTNPAFSKYYITISTFDGGIREMRNVRRAIGAIAMLRPVEEF